MLQPVRVVTTRIIATGLRAPAFLARFRGHHRRLGDLDQIVELESLDTRGIEGAALVLDGHLLRLTLELEDFGYAFGEQRLVAKDAAVRLQRAPQRARDFGDPFAGRRTVDARQP